MQEEISSQQGSYQHDAQQVSGKAGVVITSFRQSHRRYVSTILSRGLSPRHVSCLSGLGTCSCIDKNYLYFVPRYLSLLNVERRERRFLLLTNA